MKGVAVFLVVLAVLSLVAIHPGEAVSCSDVQNTLSPCVPFVIGGNSQPSGPCCAGVKSLYGSLQSKADRQAACNCIKSAASSFNLEAASALPGKCGISLGVSIGPNMDCSQI